MNTQLKGFTLFEVLAMLLVLSIGLFAVVGLFIHALQTASRVQGQQIGMATAISIAYDSQPFIRDASASAESTWSAPPPLSTTPFSYTAKGFVNGFYVVRRETSMPDDILSGIPGSIDARSVLVDVSVFETLGGRQVASFATRMVRIRP